MEGSACRLTSNVKWTPASALRLLLGPFNKVIKLVDGANAA